MKVYVASSYLYKAKSNFILGVSATLDGAMKICSQHLDSCRESNTNLSSILNFNELTDLDETPSNWSAKALDLTDNSVALNYTIKMTDLKDFE